MNELVVSVLVFVGSIFILIAAIGLIRFKDLYSRMHATTKATSFAILILLVGVSIYFLNWNVAIKSLLVTIFIYLTAPLASHSISKAFRNQKKD